MSKFRSSLLLVLLLGGTSPAAFEYAAPAGRGDTGVAIPSGSLSLDFNPATLGALYNWEAVASYQQPHGQGLHMVDASLAGALGGGNNFGASARFTLFDDKELNILKFTGAVGLGRMVFPGAYVGAGVRLDYDSVTVDLLQVRNVLEGGVDVGLYYKGFPFVRPDGGETILSPLALGLSFRNLLGPVNTGTNQGGFGLSLDGWRFGLAYTFLQTLTLSIESSGEAHRIGAEAVLTPALFGLRLGSAALDASLTLRTGVVAHRSSKDVSNFFADYGTLFAGAFLHPQGSPSRPSLTFGASFSILQFDVNYGISLDNALGADHRFSLAYRFGYEGSYLVASDLAVRNLFSALSKSYAQNPVGSVRLRNASPEPISAEVGFFVAGLMDAPTTSTVALRPRTEAQVDLKAVFNGAIQSWKSDRPIQGQVTITYRYKSKTIKKTLAKKFLLYDRNSITWDVPEQVMVFVTPKDPVIMEFSRKAIETADPDAGSSLPPVLVKAMAIFDSVAAGGMTYVHSASGAFASDASTRSAIDTVQYPRETLKLRAGKCGDTTVLYCSLLESVGIETAFIDIPGHVYMMFNTEVPAANASTVSPDPADYVIRDGTAWVGVETTVWKDGFLAAWREGMREYAKWMKR